MKTNIMMGMINTRFLSVKVRSKVINEMNIPAVPLAIKADQAIMSPNNI